MARLPAIRPREIVRFLEQHGFVLDRTREAILSIFIRFQSVGRLSRNIIVTCPRELCFRC